jgi:[FeFe] hydrogenase H-cluster maturation GTPase HydF
MNLNQTPGANRITIGFFGRTNVGKSSLVNRITNQNLSIVSSQAGTTTDPVKKAMELLPLGPVVIVDTPGLEDDGTLGALRENRAKQWLHTVDIGVLVLDARQYHTLSESEQMILTSFVEQKIPYLIAVNQFDQLLPADAKPQELSDAQTPDITPEHPLFAHREHVVFVSAAYDINLTTCKERLARLAPTAQKPKFFIRDRLHKGDTAVLVIPIDESAPKGRIILPQQQVLRELLEADIVCACTQETQLETAINRLQPKVVITDSQVFHKIKDRVPNDIYLTSFSILMARYKDNLATAVSGANALNQLADGARILISEGCTHHRQCNDIGTVKLPRWIQEYTKKEFLFEWTSGTEFPEDLGSYQLVVHCGGCMLNEREMQFRYKSAKQQNIPITNYGILIAHIRGILERSIEIFQ